MQRNIQNDYKDDVREKSRFPRILHRNEQEMFITRDDSQSQRVICLNAVFFVKKLQ